MERRLEGKTAIITGCNRGIGLAVMKKFAQEGCNIIALIRRKLQEFEAVKEQLTKDNGIEIQCITAELSDDCSVKEAIRQIHELRKPIHILVNNAGIAEYPGISRMKMESAKLIFQVNYFAALALIQGCILPMMKAKGASVINMGSVAGIDGPPGNCGYGASKAALMLATKTIAKELASLKIRANAIAPGYIETDMQHEMSEDFAKSMLSGVALHRVGNPSEVADLAAYLASDEASYITGQIIRIDGGQ